MNSLLQSLGQFLAREGDMLLAGSTLLLLAGTIAAGCLRSPVKRQHAAELAMLGVLVWLALACMPLPRRAGWPRRPAAPAEAVATRLPAALQSAAPLADAVVDPNATSESSAQPREIDTDAFHDLESLLATQATGAALEPLERTEPSPASVVLASEPAAAADAGTGVREAAATWYLAGALLCAGWLLFGRWLLWRVVHAAVPPAPWLADLYGTIVPAGSRPRLLVAKRCSRPLVCGVWRPAILLPDDCCRPELADQLRHVLRHEVCHLRRRDPWGQQLFYISLPLLYFHPLYWWLRGAAQFSRELVADAWAAGHASPEAYACQLIDLARRRGSRRRLEWSVLGVFALGSRGQFYRRMTMLLERQKPLATSCTPGWRATSATVSALVVAAAAWWWGAEYSVAGLPDPNAKATEENDPDVAGLLDKIKALEKELDSLRAVHKALAAEQDAKAAKDAAGSDDKKAAKEADLEAVKKHKHDLDKQAVKEHADAKHDELLRKKGYLPHGKGDVEKRKGEKKAAIQEELELLRLKEAELREHKRFDEADALAKKLKAVEDELHGSPDAPEKKELLKDQATTRFARWKEKLKHQDEDARTGITLRGDATAAAGMQLDLVQLADRYTDAVSEIQVAQVRLAEYMTVNEKKSGIIPAPEIAVAQLAVESAQRKVELFRQIAEIAAEAARAELAALESDKAMTAELYKAGQADARELAKTEARLAQVQAHLKILTLITAKTAAKTAK